MLFFFVAVVVVDCVATTLPLGGMTSGELAASYPSLLVPAGFTFSIRGVIYLLLFGFIIRQIIDTHRTKPLGITKEIGLWFIISCLANIGRIFAWHYGQILLSVVVMLILLVSLIIITQKVAMGEKIGTWKDKLFFQTPFAVYLGRISVFTIVNDSTLLVYFGRGMLGLTELFWTGLTIVMITILAILALYKNYNIPFALVVVWLFYGIFSKRVAINPVYSSSIIWILGVCSVVILGLIVLRWKKWIKN